MAMTFLLMLAAAAPEVPVSSVQIAQKGTVYVLSNIIDDNPLYTFDLDEPGKSNCTGACAAAWRPLWASESERLVGKWTQVKREDGGVQWAYDGKPVYSFAQDPEPVPLANGKVGNWLRLPTFPAQ